MSGLGFNAHIGLAKESSGGTAVGATDYIEALSETLNREDDRFDVANMTGQGNFHEPDDLRGVRRIGGDIVAVPKPDPLGLFLLGGMGNLTTTSVGNGLFNHAFTMRTSQFDSKFYGQPLTFEIARDVTSAQQYTGCVVSQLDFQIQPNQGLQMTASIVGIDENIIAATTPSFVNSPSQPFAFDTASLSLGGSATELYESLTISIQNQLEGVPVLGQKTNAKILASGPPLIRVSGSLAFETITEYLNYRDQTEQQLKLHLTRANSFAITFDIPRLVYSAFPLGVSGRDRQVININAIGRFDNGSNQAIQVDLNNVRSSY